MREAFGKFVKNSFGIFLNYHRLKFALLIDTYDLCSGKLQKSNDIYNCKKYCKYLLNYIYICPQTYLVQVSLKYFDRISPGS